MGPSEDASGNPDSGTPTTTGCCYTERKAIFRVPGLPYLPVTRHGVAIHLLTLAVALQAHGSVGKLTRIPGREQRGGAGRRGEIEITVL